MIRCRASAPAGALQLLRLPGRRATIFLVNFPAAAVVTVSLAQAKAHLSELLDKVERGEGVVITRHGRPVARVTLAERRKLPLPLEALEVFRATMPPLRQSSAEFLREARDEGL